MGRIMSRSKPVIEGSTGIKFTEIIVIAMAIAGIVIGVRTFLDYRQGPNFALMEFMGAVKAGNIENQYKLLDEKDKASYFPTLHDYHSASTLSHGYTERVENTSLGTAEKSSSPDKVTIPMTNIIRASSDGKQLYENGKTQSYNDRIVMRKNSSGSWRVVLSESVDKSTGKLHMQAAPPSPEGF